MRSRRGRYKTEARVAVATDTIAARGTNDRQKRRGVVMTSASHRTEPGTAADGAGDGGGRGRGETRDQDLT